MRNTEQEQAEAMKRYIREVFIPEYAKYFNKGLSEADIKFYGKIHFDRSRSDNELNMHCHLIVSRKDQANKKKLSPLTNHKNTTNGVIEGGFDRVNLFQQAEQGFDKLFSYNRQLSESFEYANTMKNGSMDDKLKMQELKEPKYYFAGEKKKEIFQSSEKENIISCNLDSKADNKHSYNQQNITNFFSTDKSTQELEKILAEELFVQTYKRLLDIYCKTPTELYVDLVRRYPDFLNYITLREIASFLRVTPETISHIRKNIKGIEFC